MSVKKSISKKGIVCPIVSRDFNRCGRVDLVDLQSIPDRNYKWLLHYQDHTTKFSFLRPLTSKRATEVALELLKIFLEVGCPRILQSDNGREFETVNNSTSTPASTVQTSVVLLASEGKTAVNDSKACCVVCGMESTGAHSCAICKNQVRAICGNAVGEEGYGSKILCYLWRKEENVKYQRENAAKHLKRSAEKMKEVSLKKFKDLSVDSTVLVNVPKVDRGPLDGSNIVGIILDTKNNLYQIGTSAGIIKDWLPRNALQIATTTFTEIVPRINLSLREIAKKLSLFEEEIKKAQILSQESEEKTDQFKSSMVDSSMRAFKSKKKKEKKTA
ncbi:SCAN domain-containing protein 3 [Trichonephila clavipes]|nr:SCAN domain-containing protein 3 [Trichonephila clavipes]